MYTAMIELNRIFTKKCNSNRKDFINYFQDLTIFNDEDFPKFDKYRRHIIKYFFQIYLLKKADSIDNSMMKIIIRKEDVDFLLNIIEPMELATNENYNRNFFDVFRILYPELSNHKI
jgi:hypothetical protein